MKFPPNIAMTITHNEHNVTYKTVLDTLEEIAAVGGRTAPYDADEWVSREDYEAAIESMEIWETHWYPRTPVGFCRVFGSTFEKMMEAAGL